MATGLSGVNPVDPGTYYFPETATQAHSWLCLNDVADRITVKWAWHKPSGALYREHTESFPDPGFDAWHEAVKASDLIDIAGAPPVDDPGTWRVKVYVQDVEGNWDLEYTSGFKVVFEHGVFLPLISRPDP
jgi:hypothetical protein